MWKLRIKIENYKPPIEAYGQTEYASKGEASEAAYQLMYGLTRNGHRKVLWLEGPNGEKVEQEEIGAWCRSRSNPKV